MVNWMYYGVKMKPNSRIPKADQNKSRMVNSKRLDHLLNFNHPKYSSDGSALGLIEGDG